MTDETPAPSASVDVGVLQRFSLLRKLTEGDVAREGAASSTMVRAGLLLEILDQLEAQAAQIEALTAALVKADAVIRLFTPEAIGEAVHTGLRKGTDADDAHVIWSIIANSNTTAWHDACVYGLDPFFSMWGGNEALVAASQALSASAALQEPAR